MASVSGSSGAFYTEERSSYSGSSSRSSTQFFATNEIETLTTSQLNKKLDRSKSLSEAKKIIGTLTILASIAVIGTLLAAYHLHGGSSPLAFQATLYTGIALAGALILLSISLVAAVLLKKSVDKELNHAQHYREALVTMAPKDQKAF